MKILCLIPARSGSKGIIDKNIMPYNGLPLIAWTIKQGLDCAKSLAPKHSMRVIVSTDSEKYAEISREYGAETPFLRPTDISNDLSTDFEFISHALHWLKDNENYIPDIVLQLRCTSPTRTVKQINDALNKFIEIRDHYDSLRTVIKNDEKTPYKMYRIIDGILTPLFCEVDYIKEPYNQCRQALPVTYSHNGYIDILNASIVNQKGSISGDKIYPYLMDNEHNLDIDYKEDLD